MKLSENVQNGMEEKKYPLGTCYGRDYFWAKVNVCVMHNLSIHVPLLRELLFTQSTEPLSNFKYIISQLRY